MKLRLTVGLTLVLAGAVASFTPSASGFKTINIEKSPNVATGNISIFSIPSLIIVKCNKAKFTYESKAGKFELFSQTPAWEECEAEFAGVKTGETIKATNEAIQDHILTGERQFLPVNPMLPQRITMTQAAIGCVINIENEEKFVESLVFSNTSKVYTIKGNPKAMKYNSTKCPGLKSNGSDGEWKETVEGTGAKFE